MNKNKKHNIEQIKKGTLDQKHTEKINEFEKLGKSLPGKKHKLVKLKDELNNLANMNPNKYTCDDIRRKSHLMDAIEKLNVEIKSIENCTESLNYIVKTLPILVNYYDNNEQMDDCVEDDLIDEMNENGKKNILSYFMRETNKNAKKPSGSKTNFIKNNRQMSRAKLYDSYLNVTETNKKIIRKINNMCSKSDCDGEKFLDQNNGFMVCNKCGLSEKMLLTSEKPNYKEPTQDSGTYAYKRINHLSEILSQLQAKESTDIPSKIFENILRELKKRKIDKNDLDIFRLRRILKKLNCRKYYEHVPHILQIINGKEPPNFSRKDEMKIKKMFKDIQKPFSIYCPKNRKNFLNYSYVLHKFCELLDLDEYIGYFPLLKNNAKLLQHDRIWKNICKYMKWEYYKSI